MKTLMIITSLFSLMFLCQNALVPSIPSSYVEILIPRRMVLRGGTLSSQTVEAVKNLPANEGDAREMGSILGLESSLEVGNGNPPQHSCLEVPMDRGDWQAIIHGVAESRT